MRGLLALANDLLMSLPRLAVVFLAAAAFLLAACSAPASSATVTQSPTAASSESTASAPLVVAPEPTSIPTPPPPTAEPESESEPVEPSEPELPSVEVAADIADLQQILSALAAAYTSPGEFGFAVTDIQVGETVGVNVDRHHLTGCTINYFVLLQSTIDAQNGRVEESAVGDLISATIRTSNPVTAHELYTIAGDGDVMAGIERVAVLIDELTDDGAVFDHPPLYADDSRGIDRNNYITPAAINEALRATYAGGILEDEWRDYLLEKMTEVKDGLNYLLAVEPDVPVSHKNGFFPTESGKWIDNDVGIVRFEQNGEERAYAVSFFSQWVPEKYDDVRLGQQLSTATWQFFQERYPSAEAVTGATDAGSGS